ARLSGRIYRPCRADPAVAVISRRSGSSLMQTEDSLPGKPETRRERFTAFFGLERNVIAASAAFFLIGFGEELWKKFLPKYLETLGAGPLGIGWFGTARDFFDAIYQYPGGWLADRFGRRSAFLVFIALSFIGYAIYWLSPTV